MVLFRRNSFIAATLVFATASLAAPVRTANMESELVAENLSIQPGHPFVVGLRLKASPHWHTYWVSPGDSGQATSIAWTLPAGFSAGEIQWPQPVRLPTPPYMTFGFDGEILLMTTITPPADLAPGTRVKLDAHADWLVCRNECIPGQADYSIELPVENSAPSADPARAALFADARKSLPVVGGTDWPATFSISGNEILLKMRPPAGTTVNTKDIFFYPLGDSIIEPAEKQTATFADGTLTVHVTRAKIAGATPQVFAGVLVADGGFPPTLTGRSVQLAAQPAAVAAATKSSLSAVILFAGFLGGLILNLMPCVFPVLGIKILGFVHQSGADRRKVTLHGVIFTLGVLISFWALAGMLLALRASGQERGWGYQMQSPEFVFSLAVFFLIFALNLSGLFEVGLSMTGVGGSLQSKSGFVGSFFTGVLATIAATPCAAPFLATALGAAVTLPPTQSFALFTIIGLGLSTPYLVLSAFPSLVKMLPRPGPWMETFKQLMAFPLYATVVVLVWVLALQVPDGLLQVNIGLVLVAMAAWVYGRWTQNGSAGARRAFGFVAAAILVTAGFALGYQHRQSSEPAGVTGEKAEIAWQKWSPETVAKLRSEGKSIYVDFTARWCLTCQVNKARVFTSKEVREAFQRKGVVPLEADWTNYNPEITRALAALGRSAVPVNLVYVPGVDEPIILSELLSPGQVLEALERVPTPKSVAVTP